MKKELWFIGRKNKDGETQLYMVSDGLAASFTTKQKALTFIREKKLDKDVLTFSILVDQESDKYPIN